MTKKQSKIVFAACQSITVGTGADVVDFPEGTFVILGTFKTLAEAKDLTHDRYPIAKVDCSGPRPQFIAWALAPKTL